MKWEYKIVRVSEYAIIDRLEEYLREKGEEGWELCSCEGLIPTRLRHELATAMLVFKRPKQ